MKSILLLLALVFNANADEEKKTDSELLKEAQGIFNPLPDSLIDVQKNETLIGLGEKLYFEKKLSINNTISCNSCHMLEKFGVDNEATSPGHDGTRGGRNSPTVYNAGLNFMQFWDGRAKDLEEQAVGPILNPIEHGLPNEKVALDKINSKEYIELFAKAFPNEKSAFNFKNVGIAIGAFEKTLLTPSRFDDYLKGDVNALTNKEKKGLQKFITIGCVSCHDGAGIGGGSFMKLGAINEYETKDLGRFDLTKDEDDKKVFKVPTLRNITKTGPYLHDGSIKSLDEMIRLMGFHQLDVKLNKNDISDIKTFLASLEGKKNTFYKKK